MRLSVNPSVDRRFDGNEIGAVDKQCTQIGIRLKFGFTALLNVLHDIDAVIGVDNAVLVHKRMKSLSREYAADPFPVFQHVQ